MAAGVGKTYRALDELRAEADSGRDAVVAFLEPHGRAATVARAQGLEVLPRRAVSHRGVELGELDLPAALTRRPEVALVDELAHTNAPGLEHAKRWQDVEDMLTAGIDVISTVNIQHLESLNDVIFEITGVRVRETVPDRVVEDADDLLVVDLTPAALVERLRAGRIYAPEQVERALNGFFKVEQLAALRELVLRQVAETVQARREIPEGDLADVGERIVAWVPDPLTGAPVVRRAARSARRLRAPLWVLVTRPPRPPTQEEQRAIDAISRLCATQHAELRVRAGEDPLAAVTELGRELEATYIFMAPPPRRRLGTPTVDRLLEALPGADIRLVRDREG